MDTVVDALKSSDLHAGLLPGLVAAAVFGFGRRRRFATLVVGAAMLAGLVLWGDGLGNVPPAWTVLLLLAAVVVASRGVVEVQQAAGVPVGATMLVLSVVGVWAAVPDTEAILLVGGVLVPPVVVLAIRNWSLASWWPTAAVYVVPIAWAVAEGGRPRPGSVVGGVACLGLLLVVPLLPGKAPSAPTPTILIHAAAVLLAARVVARVDEATTAAVLAIGVLGVAAIVSALVARPPGRRRRRG